MDILCALLIMWTNYWCDRAGNDDFNTREVATGMLIIGDESILRARYKDKDIEIARRAERVVLNRYALLGDISDTRTELRNYIDRYKTQFGYHRDSHVYKLATQYGSVRVGSCWYLDALRTAAATIGSYTAYSNDYTYSPNLFGIEFIAKPQIYYQPSQSDDLPE